MPGGNSAHRADATLANCSHGFPAPASGFSAPAFSNRTAAWPAITAPTWRGTHRSRPKSPAMPPARSVYLHALTGDAAYLDRAAAAARFLTRRPGTAPSPPCRLSFRAGLHLFLRLRHRRARPAFGVARHAANPNFCDTAAAMGRHMARDFRAGRWLPSRPRAARQAARASAIALRWSRSPGCYQLKAAMAWWDLAEATGEPRFREPYERVLRMRSAPAPASCPAIPSAPQGDGPPARLPLFPGRPAAARARAALLRRACRRHRPRGCPALREIAPEFERSDVYAQLLRMRLYADCAGAVPLDRAAAANAKPARLAEFQAATTAASISGAEPASGCPT